MDRPCLKPTPPCSAAISSAALSMFLLLQRWALSRVSNVVRPIFSFEDNRLTTVFTWMPEQCEQPKDDKASSSCCFGWAVVLALKNCGSLWEAVLLALKNWGCVLAFDPVFFRREDWCVTAAATKATCVGVAVLGRRKKSLTAPTSVAESFSPL